MKNVIDELINKQDVYNKLILIYGDEKYLKDLAISKIKKCFGSLEKGINYIVLDESTIFNLVIEATTPAFGYENKLIIVNSSNLFKINRKNSVNNEKEKTNDNNDEIFEFLSKIELINVTIIFNETDVAKTKKIYKLFDKKGIVAEYIQLKENEIASYCIDIAKKYEVTFSKENALYFANICSNNMEDVINELRKLIEYVGSGGEIKKEYIDLITTKDLSAVIFDLTDCLGKKQISESIGMLNELLKQKEPLQMIYIMLYRHFKNIFLIKSAMEKGLQNINNELSLHPFVFNKCVEQARNYSLDKITLIYKEFMKIDINNKSGNIDLYDGIINVICMI